MSKSSQRTYSRIVAMIAFKQRCDRGTAEACFRLDTMHGKNLGGLHNYLEEVLPLYDKACASHVENSCELATAYRDEQAKRGATGSAASMFSAPGTATAPSSSLPDRDCRPARDWSAC